MDRTIPPGIPGGEDAGAVVGVVGLDNVGRNSPKGSNRANPGNKRKVDNRAKGKVASRIAAPAVVPGDVPAVRVGTSSAALGR